MIDASCDVIGVHRRMAGEMKQAAGPVQNGSVRVWVDSEDLLHQGIERQPSRAKIGAVIRRMGSAYVDICGLRLAGVGETPVLKAAVGTMLVFESVVLKRQSSSFAKKKVLFFCIGPLTEYPAWLRTKGS